MKKHNPLFSCDCQKFTDIKSNRVFSNNSSIYEDKRPVPAKKELITLSLIYIPKKNVPLSEKHNSSEIRRADLKAQRVINQISKNQAKIKTKEMIIFYKRIIDPIVNFLNTSYSLTKNKET